MSKAEKTGQRELTRKQRVQVTSLLIGAVFNTAEAFNNPSEELIAVLARGLGTFSRDAPAGPEAVAVAVDVATSMLKGLPSGQRDSPTLIAKLAEDFVLATHPPASTSPKRPELATV